MNRVDEFLKLGLHLHANEMRTQMTHVDKRQGRTYVTFVHCLAFAEATNRPYINVLYANSLWCTDSRRIAFGCSPNVRHTAKCCLPRLNNISTSNVRIIFKCRVCICLLFRFRSKPGFRWITNGSHTIHILVIHLNTFLYTFISFTFQGWIRYRPFCCGRTPGALVKTIKYLKFRIILIIPVYNLTLHLTLPYFLPYLTLPYTVRPESNKTTAAKMVLVARSLWNFVYYFV